ncbi:MAG: hypothetical protein ACRCU0_03795 [Candidatus Rhabdochlamydia sp.]
MDENSYRILQTSEYSDWISNEPPRSQVQINKRLSMIKFDGYFLVTISQSHSMKRAN